MILNGELFVPPTCPAEREGGDFKIEPKDFRLYVDTEPVGHIGVTGAFYHGHSDDNDMDMIGMSYAEVDPSMPLSDYRDNPMPSAVDFRAGEIICDRIANCRGIMPDGECWALGKQAVHEIVKRLTQEEK